MTERRPPYSKRVSRPSGARDRGPLSVMLALLVLVVVVFAVTLSLALAAGGHPVKRLAQAPIRHSHVPRPRIYRAGSEPLPPPPHPRLASRETFCPILMFHYIRINPVPSDILGLHLSVTPAEFNAEMRFLRNNNYQAVTISQLADHIRYGTALPAKCVALTFDDGYEDQYTAALPTLLRYGLRGTFFIVSGFANQPRYMTWKQIRTADQDGMEIGVHTIHHLDLTTLTPWQDWQEIHHSKIVIEQHVGHPVYSFAYPSGRYNQLVLNDVGKSGYLAAVSTDPGTLHSQRSLNYLFRVRILNSDTPQTMDWYLNTRFGNPFGPAPQLVSPTGG
ncbi:MAG TPA: polysaccharide deacetylase family protein [Chloroflexota bacterium]|nr:polysaccharide deacetylase family protein [Chloroflexota bacterium]